MQTNQFIGLAVLAVVLLATAWVITSSLPTTQTVVVTDFESCAAAGNPVMESYPRQCAAGGVTYVEDIPPQNMQTGGGLGIQANGCAVAGCSGQLCVSAAEAENMMTTCEYRAEYACYKEASCEPQVDDSCGWTQTDDLKQCLANPPAIDDSEASGDLEQI